MKKLKIKCIFAIATLIHTLFFNNFAYASEVNEILSLINNYYYDNSDAFIMSVSSIKEKNNEKFIGIVESKMDKYSNYYTAEKVRSEVVQQMNNSIEYFSIDNKVYKIKINSFESGVDITFFEIINNCSCDRTETLILDLSDCTGGRIDIMANIAKEIVPKGLICTLNLKNSKVEYFSELEEKPFNIIVITSSRTASAAEALTAALIESNSAIVIGEKTYGKSAVQQYFSLSEGGILKLTVGKFSTRLGNNIEGCGIKPHIIIGSLNN